MMEQLGQWLVGVTAAAILTALSDALMPEGGVKQAGRLICALVLICAVVRPVAQVELESGEAWLEDWSRERASQESQLREGWEREIKTIIEQEAGAYIVDKAARMGIQCTAEVTCVPGDGQGIWLPEAVCVSGRLTEEQEARLRALLREELGIGEEAQTYDKEGLP